MKTFELLGTNSRLNSGARPRSRAPWASMVFKSEIVLTGIYFNAWRPFLGLISMVKLIKELELPQ